MKPRSSQPQDKHIGSRIRMRRIEMKISQDELGGKIGVSFQQVQKYEKGVNRVGAARLQQIAEVLACDLRFFTLPAPGTEPGTIDSVMDSFMATKDGATIAQAFVRITDANVRRIIADFVDRLSRGATDAAIMQAAE
jgi:transcriptional regulator with XRE-family HTH domain